MRGHDLFHTAVAMTLILGGAAANYASLNFNYPVGAALSPLVEVAGVFYGIGVMHNHEKYTNEKWKPKEFF
ncbi:MAG TPA: hypothetical protein VI979_04535 [archaeon]|nr:hypothetical protein [archaeon]